MLSRPLPTCAEDYTFLTKVVNSLNLVVTADKNGKHNAGSRHYEGKAVDVRTRDKSKEEIDLAILKLREFGFWVFDERERPKGQKVWSAPHVHVEVPLCQEQYLNKILLEVGKIKTLTNIDSNIWYQELLKNASVIQPLIKNKKGLVWDYVIGKTNTSVLPPLEAQETKIY